MNREQTLMEKATDCPDCIKEGISIALCSKHSRQYDEIQKRRIRWLTNNMKSSIPQDND